MPWAPLIPTAVSARLKDADSHFLVVIVQISQSYGTVYVDTKVAVDGVFQALGKPLPELPPEESRASLHAKGAKRTSVKGIKHTSVKGTKRTSVKGKNAKKGIQLFMYLLKNTSSQ